jgi:thioredoxin-like negative regulator of GroEL
MSDLRSHLFQAESPSDAKIALDCAEAALLDGDFETAREELTEARRCNPNTFTHRHEQLKRRAWATPVEV